MRTIGPSAKVYLNVAFDKMVVFAGISATSEERTRLRDRKLRSYQTLSKEIVNLPVKSLLAFRCRMCYNVGGNVHDAYHEKPY